MEDGNKVFVFVEDGYINYENNIDDTQISYHFLENNSEMYGCNYNYETQEATEDGAGVGGCTDETVATLKSDKVTLDEIFKKADIKYSEIKNK